MYKGDIPGDPALRLHNILSTARHAVGDDKEFLQGWADFFHLGDGREAQTEAMRRLALMRQLPIEIERRVASLELGEKASRYLRWRSGIHIVLYHTQLSQKWGDVFNRLSDDSMEFLAICSDRLMSANQFDSISNEELRWIQEECGKLIAAVNAADLDPRVREFILHHLDIIERAAIDCWVSGPLALRYGIEQSAGAWVVCSDETRARAKKSEFWPHVVTVFGRMWVAVRFTNDTLKLAEHVRGLLPDPTGTKPVD